MKKIICNILVIACVLIAPTFSFADSSYAADRNIDSKCDSSIISKTYNEMGERELVSFLRENGDICSNDFRAEKMSLKEAKEYIGNINNIDISDSDIYYVENKSGDIVEKSIIADIAVAASENFDLSKHTTLQKQNISRSRYFNSEAPSASVKAKYSVAGTVNGNKFSFDVIAEAF